MTQYGHELACTVTHIRPGFGDADRQDNSSSMMILCDMMIVVLRHYFVESVAFTALHTCQQQRMKKRDKADKKACDILFARCKQDSSIMTANSMLDTSSLRSFIYNLCYMYMK